MATVTAPPAAPTESQPLSSLGSQIGRSAARASRSAFEALLYRDLAVLKKNLREFITRRTYADHKHSDCLRDPRLHSTPLRHQDRHPAGPRSVRGHHPAHHVRRGLLIGLEYAAPGAGRRVQLAGGPRNAHPLDLNHQG